MHPDHPILGRWAPTRALGRCVLLVGLLIFLAVLVRRVDLVVLAVPFALGAAAGLSRRPVQLPVAGTVEGGQPLTEAAAVHLSVRVTNPDRTGYDLVVLRTSASPWLRVRHLDRPYVTALRGGSTASVELTGEALRWGRQPVGPTVAYPVAAAGLLIGAPVAGDAGRLTVYPRTEPFEAVEAMPRAAGLIGAHRSRRPGEGGELAGVRMFAPGDRLRRIDWRVSLRARELHVAATLSERDAEVLLLLDVLHEAGSSGGVHGTPSVLDTSVRAAAGIAQHYLHAGDRVALLEYGLRARRLRAAAGRRHYLTVLEWLLDVDVHAGGYEPPPEAVGPQAVPASALVVVLTPLLDHRATGMVARLARAGRFVVAVDTLPPDLPCSRRGDWAVAAARIWRIERDNTVGLLREHGVPVVTWAGAGSLDEVLRQVSRMAGAPRAVLR